MGDSVFNSEFPYDYVYFKAKSYQKVMEDSEPYFHTITSILKLTSEKKGDTLIWLFPYDYVYFKALIGDF